MTTENQRSERTSEQLEAELARVHAELAATQRLLADARRAFAQAPGLIAIARGPQHVFEFANALYRSLVAPGREIVGKPVREALPELEGQGIFELLDGVYQTGTPFVGKEVLMQLDPLGDGRLQGVYFDFVYQPLRGPDGQVDGLFVHGVDVTDKVLARQALRHENERIEAEVARRTHELATQKAFAESIIQNVPAGVAWLDKDWVYRVVNTEYAEGFMKAPREKFLDRYIFDALPGTERQIEHLIRGVFETGEPYYATDFAFVFLHEGQQVTSYWDFVYYPSFDEDGRTVNGFFILAHEVSTRFNRERERERLQHERIEALEQTDRLKDEFLSILSHELRTPINAIMGFGSVLADDVAGPLTEPQRAYTRKILASADSLLALIDDLLIVSRVQAGKFSITPTAVDFGELVARALEPLVPQAEKRSIQLINEVPTDLPSLRGDPQRLTQVVANLVGNAIKFTPDTGTITLRAFRDACGLRCEVTDTGFGIAPDDQPKLFKRFGLLDTSNTRSTKGTGLGLSIVKAIVEAHGGSVGVTSTLERGSTFWFCVPLAGPD